MSDIYKFKAMSEVELLEEPGEGTTILAVENGAVKQVPAQKLGGGGGGYMVRAAVDVSDYSLTADKTYAEIVAAVEEGCAPVLYLSVMDTAFYLLPMVTAMNNELTFMVYTGNGVMAVSCTSEDVWALVPTD